MIRELVQAHVFVAALAFLLDRLLEKKLKAAKLPFSPEEALTTHAPSKDARGRHHWHQTPRSHGGKPTWAAGSFPPSELASWSLGNPKIAPKTLT